MSNVLFKRSVNGDILRWQAEVVTGIIDGFPVCLIEYRYGVLGGTLKTSHSDPIKAKSKKSDKAQAEFELESLYARHEKQGYKPLAKLLSTACQINLIYYESLAETNNIELIGILNCSMPKYNTDANNCVKPMKCQKFAIGKFTYPCIIQPKINGVRAIIMCEEYTPKDMFDMECSFVDNNVRYKAVIKTKEGLEYSIKHIQYLFNELYEKYPEYRNIVFDGEIYIKDEKVTSIGGAARNPRNELHSKLQFVNFDLSIPDLNNEDRDQLRNEIWDTYVAGNTNIYKANIWNNLNNESHKFWKSFYVVNLHSHHCYSDDAALAYMEDCIVHGFEGAVIRNKESEYKFGSRPQTMMKLKKFEDAEFKCIDYKWSGDPDNKVGFSVVLVCQNDINDCIFECTCTGSTEERKAIIDNPPIGKMVTIKFYERTKDGIPFHANVIGIRDYE